MTMEHTPQEAADSPGILSGASPLLFHALQLNSAVPAHELSRPSQGLTGQVLMMDNTRDCLLRCVILLDHERPYYTKGKGLNADQL